MNMQNGHNCVVYVPVLLHNAKFISLWGLGDDFQEAGVVFYFKIGIDSWAYVIFTIDIDGRCWI